MTSLRHNLLEILFQNVPFWNIAKGTKDPGVECFHQSNCFFSDQSPIIALPCLSLSSLVKVTKYGFVEIVKWICQSCFMFSLPFTKQNKTDVWPRFQSFQSCWMSQISQCLGSLLLLAMFSHITSWSQFSLRFLAKLQLQNLKQTSGSESWPNLSFKMSIELQLVKSTKQEFVIIESLTRVDNDRIR